MIRSLGIVIVNWNAGEQLRRFVETIGKSASREAKIERVVVVDNGSRDGSAEGLSCPGLNVVVIRNEKNCGFARACNQGAAESGAEYLLFVNPDMMLTPGSIEVAVRFMEEPGNQRIGICGIQLVDEEGRVQRSCSRFPKPGRLVARAIGIDRICPSIFPPHFFSAAEHTATRRVDQVMGAFMLVRRELFEALEGFDERFFVYFEDVDLSLRAAKAGWSSWYLAEAQAYHKGGGCSEKAKAERLFYSLRSRMQYARKHFGRVGAAGVAAATLMIEPWTRILWAVARGSWEGVKETAGGYWRLYGWMVERRGIHRS